MNADAVTLFDLHCHLDLFPNPAAVFEECRRTKLLTIAVTTTPRAWSQNCQWARGNSYVRPALGLHPELIASYGGEIDQLLELMKGVSIIGETGLDGGSRYRASYQDQLRIFKRIVSGSAREPGRILSIHSRSAVKDVLDVLRPHAHDLRPILHWFSGTVPQLKAAVGIGCFFSVNGSMTSTDSGKSVIAAIPLDRLLLESDAPFRKEASTTAGRIKDLERTLTDIAVLKRIDVAALRDRISKTSAKLLGSN